MLALAITVSTSVNASEAQAVPTPVKGDPSAFEGNGQWIWLVNKSGGTGEKIAEIAKKYNLDTVFVKSGDGTDHWEQFADVVEPIKRAGIKVCAWQYIYGSSPATEARVAARSIREGADCFVINAEVEFKRAGGWKAARKFMTTLRRSVGFDYPIGMTSFAWVHYHTNFPYSAFFYGKYGAQVDMPQVYWRAFGTSVANAVSNTYKWNNIYGRPIAPLGQTYMSPPASQIEQFRCQAASFGGTGVSYWAWQNTNTSQWKSIGKDLSCAKNPAQAFRVFPNLGTGSSGDPARWLQLKLRDAGQKVSVTGTFGSQTKAAVKAFQTARGLTVNGVADTDTWRALLGLDK